MTQPPDTISCMCCGHAGKDRLRQTEQENSPALQPQQEHGSSAGLGNINHRKMLPAVVKVLLCWLRKVIWGVLNHVLVCSCLGTTCGLGTMGPHMHTCSCVLSAVFALLLECML